MYHLSRVMFEKLFAKDGLSLDRLRALVEVADAGGMAAAAPNDPGKQSQYSHQINRLRQFFGVEITRRKGKGIELTEAGEKLAQQARTCLAGLEDFLEEVQGQPVELRLGANNTAVDWLFVPILPELSRQLGGARFVLRGCRSQEVVDGLLDGSLDFGLVRQSALVSSRLKTIPFASVKYALFAHRALGRRFKEDPLAILQGVPIATSMGGEFRRQFDARLDDAGMEVDLRYACSSFREALELLKRDASLVAVLPASAERNLPEKRFSRIELPLMAGYRRDSMLAWNPKNVEVRRGAADALELLKATGRELNG
jgi:DNA-binding transcriptional LysR family regulator